MRSVQLRRKGRLALTALVTLGVAGALAACGSSNDTSTATATTSAAGASNAAASGSLASVCPSTIKIQTGWYPEAEKGGLYQIVGPDGTVDADNGSYNGTVDGVTVSILSGGPYLGNQPVTSRMYADSSILLGEVSTDDAIEVSAKNPVINVFAGMQKSPLGVIYDPTVYHFTSIADVGKSGATILTEGENAATDILMANGSINKSQIDFSYDGSPGRFISAGGKDVTIDYATESPYNLEHFKQWGKPLSSLLLADSGYSSYENALSVTPENEQKYSACLSKFIPLAQKALVTYATDPGPMNAALIKAATTLRSPTTVTAGLNAFTDKVMKDKGIIANGSDGVAGSFDTARVTKLISSMQSVAKAENLTFKSGLTAQDVVTDKFLDPSISIPQ
jgi:hypothetical protein